MTSTVGITTAAALDVALLDAAGLRPGARVLDVGCGRGDTTLDATRRHNGSHRSGSTRS
jgi:cyclopropane fatty-acyl-phospholipid synthase-like methyltransferase